MPSIRFSRTSSAMRATMDALFTWNGIAVMMIASRSLRMVSIVATPRMTTEPLPVISASRAPVRPMISPPVGKSGAGTMSRNSSRGISGRSIRARQASTISPRLCGGMLVAMPTAMPPAPLTSRLGMRDGRTEGSRSLPS